MNSQGRQKKEKKEKKKGSQSAIVQKMANAKNLSLLHRGYFKCFNYCTMITSSSAQRQFSRLTNPPKSPNASFIHADDGELNIGGGLPRFRWQTVSVRIQECQSSRPKT